jgi:fatty acyl-CoA reductase
VHLSTAFCHCDLEVLEEKVYQSALDPHDVMRFLQWIDETTLDMITVR